MRIRPRTRRTLTADEDYTIQSVTVTMGGVDISSCYANGVITIPNVTGDVVDTAAARRQVYADIRAVQNGRGRAE